MTLRTKFLLSLALISALLTTSVLLVVRYRVQVHAREEIRQALNTSVAAFLTLQHQREATLERSAALLAALPPLKAVMTSGHAATIQDASRPFWQLAGSQVFVLTDADGEIAALHASAPGFPASVARASAARFLAGGDARDWWFGGGHLYQVFFQPIFFGADSANVRIGMLAVGYEIDAAVAADIQRVASSHVGFGFDRELVVTTVDDRARPTLAAHVAAVPQGTATEVLLGAERHLATSVVLSSGTTMPVTLTVLKSFDAATAFIEDVNRWIVGLGIAAVVTGSALVFLVSTTFTRPLGQLVAGVRALERGDFAYPLEGGGGDEVSTLTNAFQSMRHRLFETQRQLVENEQLATVGRLASTMSHDLRHPLTAILAYAEFLAEGDLTDEKRQDFYKEIRVAVNRMIDEINALLGFSKESDTLRLVEGEVADVIDRAIRTMKALPEFERTVIRFDRTDTGLARFDPAKLERALLNLLSNAAEAVAPDSGVVSVTCRAGGAVVEIRVQDNGPGIPPTILENLFRPFVSFGKEKGIGLGLTIVQAVLRQHGGKAVLESTGAAGTVFLLSLPRDPGLPVNTDA